MTPQRLLELERQAVALQEDGHLEGTVILELIEALLEARTWTAARLHEGLDVLAAQYLFDSANSEKRLSDTTVMELLRWSNKREARVENEALVSVEVVERLRAELEAVRGERGLLESQNAALSRRAIEAEERLELQQEQLANAERQSARFVRTELQLGELRVQQFRVFNWACGMGHEMPERGSPEDTYVGGYTTAQREVQLLLGDVRAPSVSEDTAPFPASLRNTDLLELRLLVGQLVVLVQRLRQEGGREWLPAVERMLDRLRRVLPLGMVEDRSPEQLEADGDALPKVEALSTLNTFAITAAPLLSAGAQVVVAMQRLGQVWEPERALELAAWLIVGAELAGYERSLEVTMATVKAIRNT